jgi:hypothetical protein
MITPAGSPSAALTASRRSGGFDGSALAGLCVAVCGVWAFLPLEPAGVDVPEIAQDSGAAPQAAPLSLDLAAFNAPLWVAPPPPKVAEAIPPAPPLPPLRWQLLAIVREDAGFKALVYDPDTDKLLVLGEGDQSGPRRIARVSPTSTDVRDGAGVRTLALRDQAGGRP